jgi:hypothetical protein
VKTTVKKVAKKVKKVAKKVAKKVKKVAKKAKKFAQKIGSKIGGWLKSTFGGLLKKILKRLVKALKIYVPCQIRNPIVRIVEKVIDKGFEPRTFDYMWAQSHTILDHTVPAIIYSEIKRTKWPHAKATAMMFCQRFRDFIPHAHSVRIIAQKDEVGLEDWDVYRDPSKLAIYAALAPRDWFKTKSPVSKAIRAGMPCLDPTRSHGPETGFDGWNATQKRPLAVFKKGVYQGEHCAVKWYGEKHGDPGPRCLVKVEMVMEICNTCCCKQGPAQAKVKSDLVEWGEKGKGGPAQCGAFFGVADAVLRSVFSMIRSGFVTVNMYSRCWRGTKPYNKPGADQAVHRPQQRGPWKN